MAGIGQYYLGPIIFHIFNEIFLWKFIWKLKQIILEVCSSSNTVRISETWAGEGGSEPAPQPGPPNQKKQKKQKEIKKKQQKTKKQKKTKNTKI